MVQEQNASDVLVGGPRPVRRKRKRESRRMQIGSGAGTALDYQAEGGGRKERPGKKFDQLRNHSKRTYFSGDYIHRGLTCIKKENLNMRTGAAKQPQAER